jgi:hypothetical protein
MAAIIYAEDARTAGARAFGDAIRVAGGFIDSICDADENHPGVAYFIWCGLAARLLTGGFTRADLDSYVNQFE